MEELLDRALEGVDGVLLLLDEVTGMLIRAGEERDRGLEFLKILARVVGKAEAPVAMVVSAPKGSGEVQRQLERLKEEGEVESEEALREEVHDVGEEAVEELDRVGEERIPVSDVEEAAEIARVWLLRPREGVDVEGARDAVVEAYEGLVSELASTEGVPRDEAASVVRRLRETYPFHPRLLEVLRSVTREEPYQLTRSYLEILMQVVGYAFDRWKEGRWEAPVFDLGDVFLEETEVEEAVVKPEGWEDPAGDLREKLDGLAEKEGGFARRLAYALFVRSLIPDPRKRGATPRDLLLDVVRPGEDVKLSDVERVLELMEDTLFYIHKEGERYHFDRIMNVSSVIQSYMPRDERAGWERVEEELERELSRGIRGLSRDVLVLWEDEEGLLDKLREPKPRVVVLRPWEDEERAEELWERAKMRNAPVFLVFRDGGLEGRLLNAAMRLAAVENALRSDDEVVRRHRKELRRREEEYRGRVRRILREGYTILLYPSEDGLSRDVLGVEEERSLGVALGRKLEEIGFLERVKDPRAFVSDGLVEKRVEMTPREVLEKVYSTPGCPWCREEDVLAMIMKGCEEGFFVVDTGEARFFLERPTGVDAGTEFGHPTVLHPPDGWTADFMGADETVKDFLDDVMKGLEEPRKARWNDERWLSDDELLELVKEDLPQGLERARLVLRHQDEGTIVGPGDLEEDEALLEEVLDDPNAWVFEELKVTRLVSDEVRREGSIARRELVQRLSKRFGLEESRVNGAISRLVQAGELREEDGIVSVPSEEGVTVDDVVEAVKKGGDTLDVLASRLGVNPALVEPKVVEAVKRGRLVVYRGDRPLRDLRSVSEGVRVEPPKERVDVEHEGDPEDFAGKIADAVLAVGGRARVRLELKGVKDLGYVRSEHLARFETVRAEMEVDGGVLKGEKKGLNPRNDGWWTAVTLAAGQASDASLYLTGRFDRDSLTDLEEAVGEIVDALDLEEARATVERANGTRVPTR